MFKFLQELFKPVTNFFKPFTDWVSSFFPSQEQRVEKSWTRISGRLDKLGKKREQNLPITYENVHIHKKIIREVKSLRKEIVSYRQSHLKYAFTRIDSTFKDCVEKTENQIAFAEAEGRRCKR